MLIPSFYHKLSRILFTPISVFKRNYKTHYSTQDIYACNLQIAEFSRAGKLEAARKVFDAMSERDVVSWNSLVTGYWQNGHLEKSKKLFESMTVRNVVTWNSMIAGCVENDELDEAFRYFSSMPEKNIRSWNVMVSGFLRGGRIGEAAKLFDKIPRKNVVSYTAMISGYAQNGEIVKARDLFDRMQHRNVVCWAAMISRYVENGIFDEAKKLFDQMPEKNVAAMTAMIIGYCKEGDVENGRALFDEIKRKDHISYKAMISGYAHNGYGLETLNLFKQMLRRGMQADPSTLVLILISCTSLSSLSIGKQTHVRSIKSGFEWNISVCNALVTMYSKGGSILDSELAFSCLTYPDLFSYNTIISAFAQHGIYEKSVAYYHEMTSKGIEPDGITFLNLISACGHSGLVNKSLHWFESMTKVYKIVPRSEHYTCLVDILGRAGHVEKSYNIIRNMAFEADSGIWGALLSACCAYSNVEIGELAAEKLMELNPKNSGAYVGLSNIYAEAGLWKDVKRVRGLMKEHEAKKQPACSWLEIANQVHYFVGGDVSHPNISQIRLQLKEINLQMKAKEDTADIVLENLLLG